MIKYLNTFVYVLKLSCCVKRQFLLYYVIAIATFYLFVYLFMFLRYLVLLVHVCLLNYSRVKVVLLIFRSDCVFVSVVVCGG